MSNMPKVNNDDTRTTSIDVIRVSWDQCDTYNYNLLENILANKMVSYY